jgi:hypothetical protein
VPAGEAVFAGHHELGVAEGELLRAPVQAFDALQGGRVAAYDGPA